MKSEVKKDNAMLPSQIDFHYIKANDFRVLHCDGIWGGGLGNGLIHMSILTERPPLPKKVTHSVDSDGKLGEEIARESKEGLIREVHADVVMSLAVAKLTHSWLGEKIAQLESISATHQ